MADGVGGGEHRLVLDRAHHRADLAAALARRERRADDAQVVGLGAARGEDHLVRLGAHGLGHLAAGLLDAGPGGAAEPVGARGVAEGLRW